MTTMRRLMLLRHAKAEPAGSGMRDFDRALAPAGRAAAPRIGAYMAGRALVPDLTVCSPAKRARETWDLAAGAFRDHPPTREDRRVYEQDADGLLDLVRQTPANIQVLLLVGHNPSLADLADLAVATGDPLARERLAEKMPTGALAVIDFPLDDWSKLQPRSGHLDRLVTPRALESASD
jgi:phosphohistidine phosphatase